MKPWVVIAFDEENTVATIPNTWLSKSDNGKNMCYWPTKSKNATGCVRRREEPGDDWEEYAVTILGKYDSYEIAVKKAQKAEDTSELSSTTEYSKRKRFQNKKYTFTTDMGDKSSDSEREDSDNDYPKLKIQKPSQKPLDSRNTNKKGENENILSQKSNNNLNSTPKTSYSSGRSDVELYSSTCNLEQQSTQNCIGLDNPRRTPTLTPTNTHKILTQVQVLGNSRTAKLETPNKVAEDKEFKHQVLTKLNIIMAKLSRHDENFEAINSHLDNYRARMDEEETPSAGLEFLPVVDDDSLAQIEQFLGDKNNFKKLARELSRLGGRMVPEITRKIMYKIISNDFAQQYSWEGGKGKRKFINISLSRVVIDAVRYNKRTQNSCEDEIIQEIKRWLAKAKERVTNETKKKNKFSENVEESIERRTADD